MLRIAEGLDRAGVNIRFACAFIQIFEIELRYQLRETLEVLCSESEYLKKEIKIFQVNEVVDMLQLNKLKIENAKNNIFNQWEK